MSGLLVPLAGLVITLLVQSPSTPKPETETARRVATFQLEDLAGNIHDLDAPTRGRLIIFWNPQMANSVRALGIASRISANYPELEVWTIVSGNVPLAEIEQSRKLFYTGRFEVLLDPDRKGFASLGVIALPTFFVVDSDRRVRFKMGNVTPDLETKLGLVLDDLLGKNSFHRKDAVSSSEGKGDQLPAAAKRRLTMASLLSSRGLPEEAADILTELSETLPREYAVQVAILYRALDLELWGEAGRVLERTRSLRPVGREMLAGEVYLLLRTGQSAQAGDLQEELLPTDPHREWLLQKTK